MKNAVVTPSDKRIERADCPQEGRRSIIGKLVHDLRNPVSGILSASQYLIEDAGPSLDQHQREILASIEDSGIRLLRLIEDFERRDKHSGRPLGSKEKPRRPCQAPLS
jgi:signal transduction histidine kinase